MDIIETIKTSLGKYYLAQKSGNVQEMTKAFQELVGGRNYLAVSKGFTNYLELQKNFYHIPEDNWQKYLANRDIFAAKYSPRLENTTISPHFLSQIESVSISYPEGVYEHIAQQYPEITSLRDKITISISDKGAYYKHFKENDHYEIFIPKTNHNQQVSMLIHELAHIISQEKYQHQIPNLYVDELEAHKIEIAIIQKLSKTYFQAVIREYLMCLVRTNFEISLFENTDQDSISLFSQCFQKYLGTLNPQNVTDFLLDKKLIDTPFVDLPSAVALVNLLS